MHTLYFYIAPQFINRYYLYRDIAAACAELRHQGKVLDVGCGDKPYRHLFHDAESYEGIDYAQYSNSKGMGKPGRPDHVFPADYNNTFKLPFRSRSYDHVVSFQVLEHHPEPEKMISEMSRVTREGGTLILSAPFIWGLHEEPHDYMRFTHYALVRMLNKYGYTVRNVRTQGSICSLLITLVTGYCIEIASINRFLYVCMALLYPLLLLIAYASIMLDRIFPSGTYHINYVITAVKTS